ncbi:MAG: histidinol phosphate phosphatase [Rhodospirillaceae bacterium]|nr:histidinol phosphate phosphatase [Rhodospirillaceae bacterium]
MTGACPEEFVEIANRLADASGAAIRPHFRRGIAVADKPDLSPVTVADEAAERDIRRILEQMCPGHGIVGEEFGSDGAGRDFVWVIDPIDGTRSFICGVPLFTTLIALLRDGEPILGVVDQPVLGERWVGARGRGTVFNGAPVNTAAPKPLAEAAMFTTAPDMFDGSAFGGAAAAEAYGRLRAAARLTRFGLDGYAAGLLASGLIDLHVEGDMKPWDYLALVPVIENAGGVMTGWDGDRLTLEAGDGLTLAASSPAVHAAALDILGSGRARHGG